MFTLKSLTRLVQMLYRMAHSPDVKMSKKLPIDTNSAHSNEYCRYVDASNVSVSVRFIQYSAHKYKSWLRTSKALNSSTLRRVNM